MAEKKISLNITIDAANKDKKVNCTLVVFDSGGKNPTTSQVLVASARPISVNGASQSNLETIDVDKVKSCIIELFPEEDETEQQLTFCSLNTGTIVSKTVKVLPPAPPKPTPKPGWFNATCGNPCSDKKVKGRIVVKTKDGNLVEGKVRVSSNRRFVIEKDNITGSEIEKREWLLTVDGEMLFELEMSSDANHKQQQMFFVLEETGQEIKKFLAIR